MKRIVLFFAFAAIAFVSGCNKDSSSTSKSYFDGSYSIEFPTYAQPGFTKTFNVDSMMFASRDDDGPVGYYYKSTDGVYDTLVTSDGVVVSQTFTVEVPDTLGNLSFAYGAFAAEKYYDTSKSKTFTVVKSGVDGSGSITNFSVEEGDLQFTDPRDGEPYYYTTIDGVDWLRQNLAWEGSGKAYSDCNAMSDIFGRYYTYTEAQTACPEGWTLPSDDDWLSLGKKYGVVADNRKDIESLAGDLMENLYFNGTKMWEYWKDVNVTNSSRLSVMPSGYATIEDGEYSFSAVYEYAAFWTSDESNGEGAFRYMYVDKDTVYYGLASKEDVALSVRCIRKN